jgi:hypothetical protein
MTNSIRFKIETQSKNQEVTSICYINEKRIALDTSDVARVMFEKNNQLFNKINLTTKILGGTIYRQESIRLEESLNKLMTPVDNLNEFVEKEVISIIMDGKKVEPLQRVTTKLGRVVEYNYKNLKSNFSTSRDLNNPTEDDIRDSKKVAKISEISVFSDYGIKTLVLNDYLKDQESLVDFGYRIALKVSTSFEDYILKILRELKKATSFISKLYRNYELNYDFDMRTYKKQYTKSVMNQLGITNQSNINLNSKRIKNSEFGHAARVYYNALMVMRDNVEKKVYSDILKSILPINPNELTTLLMVEKNFSKLYYSIEKEYGINKKNSLEKTRRTTSSVKEYYVEKITDERKKLEKFVIGYSLFEKKGLTINKAKPSLFIQRQRIEQSKYYPNMKSSDATGLLSSRERVEFMNMSTAPSFVTPSKILFGNREISTSRGMTNINVQDIRDFRLAKSIVSANRSISRSTPRITSLGLSKNRLAEFNLTIDVPKKTILTRATSEVIDPLVDAKRYLGEGSSFLINNPKTLHNLFNKIQRKEEGKILSIVSDILPAKYLDQEKSLKSIKDIQLSNPDSKIRKMVIEGQANLSKIPPQIKYMMTKDFVNNEDIDPIKNKDASGILKETQTNIFELKCTLGFEKGSDGIPDLYKPIETSLDSMVLSSGVPMMVKAQPYEIPELGIVKDKFEPTIYDNLTYVSSDTATSSEQREKVVSTVLAAGRRSVR